MSNDILSYKYIGKFASPATTISGTMAAYANAFSSTSYFDGTSRTPGSGVAWSVETQLSSGQVVACSLTPATSSLGQKILIAGGATGTPTIIAPDTYSTARIYMGLCKNAGSFVNWSSANPYGTGQFSNLTGFCQAVPFVHAYESADSIFLLSETAANTLYIGAAGALIDPESSTASVAEADGKLYAILTSGHGAVGGTPNYYLNFGTNSFLWYGAANGGAHSYVMTPGASTTSAIVRWNVGGPGGSAASFKNSAGEFVRIPIFMQHQSNSIFYGRLREIVVFANGLATTKFTVASVAKGYLIGSSTTSTGECILLRVS